MSAREANTGFAPVNGAQIYYEVAGEGIPFVMIHAGIADTRQWNHEFAHFAQHYQAIRFDMRGFGQSEPVEGEYTYLGDLVALLDYLQIQQPAIVMGCSIGGMLAMDFALEHPARTKALIMVASAPGGLQLDVPDDPRFAEAEAAQEAQDWDRLAEIETRIFFDGLGRTPDQMDPEVRGLAYAMNRRALAHQAKGLGTRKPSLDPLAATRLDELRMPLLVILGTRDEAYTEAAADHMVKTIPTAQKVVIEDTAHLPNMEKPAEFRQAVTSFLNRLPDNQH